MSVIKVDPEIVSGAACFEGTRVPVDSLFDWLAEGQSLDYFLHHFPQVTRDQAQAVLEEARAKLLGPHWLSDERQVALDAARRKAGAA